MLLHTEILSEEEEEEKETKGEHKKKEKTDQPQEQKTDKCQDNKENKSKEKNEIPFLGKFQRTISNHLLNLTTGLIYDEYNHNFYWGTQEGYLYIFRYDDYQKMNPLQCSSNNDSMDDQKLEQSESLNAQISELSQSEKSQQQILQTKDKEVIMIDQSNKKRYLSQNQEDEFQQKRSQFNEYSINEIMVKEEIGCTGINTIQKERNTNVDNLKTTESLLQNQKYSNSEVSSFVVNDGKKQTETNTMIITQQQNDQQEIKAESFLTNNDERQLGMKINISQTEISSNNHSNNNNRSHRTTTTITNEKQIKHEKQLSSFNSKKGQEFKPPASRFSLLNSLDDFSISNNGACIQKDQQYKKRMSERNNLLQFKAEESNILQQTQDWINQYCTKVKVGSRQIFDLVVLKDYICLSFFSNYVSVIDKINHKTVYVLKGDLIIYQGISFLCKVNHSQVIIRQDTANGINVWRLSNLHKAQPTLTKIFQTDSQYENQFHSMAVLQKSKLFIYGNNVGTINVVSLTNMKHILTFNRIFKNQIIALNLNNTTQSEDEQSQKRILIGADSKWNFKIFSLPNFNTIASFNVFNLGFTMPSFHQQMNILKFITSDAILISGSNKEAVIYNWRENKTIKSITYQSSNFCSFINFPETKSSLFLIKHFIGQKATFFITEWL